MTLRARIATLAAGAVATAILLASATVWVTTSRTLRDDVDRDLEQAARSALDRPGPGRGRFSRPEGIFGGLRPGPFGGPGTFVQLVDPSGEAIFLPAGTDALPVDARTVALADPARTGEEYVRTAEVDGIDVRIYAVGIGDGLALQVGRSIEDMQETLGRLARRLLFVSVGGVGLAALLGVVVARRAIRPVEALTDTAEHVGDTLDLSHRIDVTGNDEVARLARTFNAMLAKLEEARDAQRRLVADASHELRTPLTSLRTNVEVLAGHPDDLDADDRARLVADMTGQLDEFAQLVADLLELARGEEPVRAAETFRLDEAVADLVDGSAGVALNAEPVWVHGERDRVVRAVGNLVENAQKYAGGGAVEVAVGVQDGAAEVTVRDHGPGIADEDLPHVFDRFWRATSARGMPGSGLGLSIVKQTAEAHGGSVRAEPANGGGTRVVIRIPLAGPPEGSGEPAGPSAT